MRLNPTSLFSDYFSDSFYLSVHQDIGAVNIVMGLYSPIVNTKYLPQTTQILTDLCPAVLSTKCFNDDDLPFHEEVKKTEIGHLFEHLLLELLCQEKLSSGCRRAAYNGRTDWNWVEDIEGVFNITVDCGINDLGFLNKALEKTIHIIEQVLQSQNMLSLAIENHPVQEYRVA